MHNDLAYAIEVAIKQIAKRNMAEREYEEFVHNIRLTKMIRVGSDHKTVHDVIVAHAISIADWATNNGFTKTSDQVEEKKKKAIHNIKTHLGWS
jgi:hypothetical protein